MYLTSRMKQGEEEEKKNISIHALVLTVGEKCVEPVVMMA